MIVRVGARQLIVPSPEIAEIAVATEAPADNMEGVTEAAEDSADEAPAKEIAPDAMEAKLDASLTWPVKVVVNIGYPVSQASGEYNYLLRGEPLFNIPTTKLTHAQRLSVQPGRKALIILSELFYTFTS